MNLEQFQQLLLQKQKEIEQAMRRTLPIKVGRIAKDHFQEGFRQGGFQDNGTQPWQRKKHPDKYGPLMSSRQNLYGSSMLRPCPCFDKKTILCRAVSLYFRYDSLSFLAVFGFFFHEITRQSYTLGGLEGNPTPYPTPHPSPETASKYRMFGLLV